MTEPIAIRPEFVANVKLIIEKSALIIVSAVYDRSRYDALPRNQEPR